MSIMTNIELIFKYVIALVLCVPIITIKAQIMNRAPHFIPGTGDMSRFSLSENTTVGSPVYQLKGVDPEGSALRYSISGPVFSVDRDSGVVKLRQELDRELQDIVEVIISITDEGVLETEPNTVALRREIPIRDYNDNPPIFIGRPYSASISESTAPGTYLNVIPEIIVTDRDEGINADVNLSCYHDRSNENNDVCDYFAVRTEKISEGKFSASINLIKQLDFETKPSYILTIQAQDSATTNPLTAFATVAINVIDVQDQPPTFLNAPYSATLQENTVEDTSVLTIMATDGDTGNPRSVRLSLENDKGGHFKLRPVDGDESGKAILYTSNKPLDRENTEILQNGGVYSLSVKATELINNELPGDSTLSQITIVLTDVDDHIPEFNEPEFNIYIPENLERNVPLPGLSIFVVDKDMGMNSHYNLSLENVINSQNVFAVSPTSGEGRTPIVVKVVDSSKLDYDVKDESKRKFVFDIIASVRGKELSKARVTVNLEDANDNSPIFPQTSYDLKVKENSKVGFKIADIAATDKDTGKYGQLTYLIKGFGHDIFYTDKRKGGVYVNKNIDFEDQKSYTLTLVAVDGGGRETNANLFVDVLDENDNSPMFETLEYTRTIREGAIEFEPQFYVRATDVDGPLQGGGRVTYSIESENSISGHVFTIDEDSGEIRITRPVNSMDTERGQYEIIVGATDFGTPPRKNDTRVLVRVGISGNQRPIFKGHFTVSNNGAIPGPPSYKVSIPENAPTGFVVTEVKATDPDGIDSLLSYRIVGGSDNFQIDENTGIIRVSPDARLDRDTNQDSYAIVVNAVDAGFPIPETATTTVRVKIDDVNDKPPKFLQSTYTAYVSERSEINAEVLRVAATDSDLNSDIEYSIIEPIRATSKAGIQLASSSSSPYDFKSAFKIDENAGMIMVNNTLDYNLASVIMITVKAIDLNAELNKDIQFATTEVTLYIQSFKDTNPIFQNKGWNNLNPFINIKIKEEMPIGSTLFTLIAEDPVSLTPIYSFQIVEPDGYDYFSLNDRTGEIVLQKRLDYEALEQTEMVFKVRANSNDFQRHSVAIINASIENVNDNDPIFEKKVYKATVIESSKFPEKILTVRAKDADAVLKDIDRKLGYNVIHYSLSGNSAGLFTIDNTTGDIQIAANQILDREKQSVIRLNVIAEDSPGKPSESRKTTAEIIIDVLDVNDNPPTFPAKVYTAVIPESSPINSFVVNIVATDPDEGPGGEIRYDFTNEGEANGLLSLNPKTGEIRTKLPLTGKGRSEPYELVIRAQDNGGQIPKQSSLQSDVSFILFIGDVSANDGIPFFIAPKIGQIANITENATIGSPVFQVVASDPDSASTPSGTLKFRIQDDIEDAKAFRIDTQTGLITSMKSLDREKKSMYNIIIEVSDNGEPPQAATRVLKINVLDIDDHKPRFIRDVDSQPLELLVLEEQPPGSIVGNISAVDEDIDENGAIDYMFIDGNELDLFKITRTDKNNAIITTAQRLDHETHDMYTLTVKCYKFGTKNSQLSRKQYNAYDLSEIKVIIKIMDIDDHLPEFGLHNQTIGVRHNIPIDTSVVTLHATDVDSTAPPIVYTIENITFIPQFYTRNNSTFKDYSNIFDLNNKTGEIRTAQSLSNFVDGYFELNIRANNSFNLNRFRDNILRIFIIRDKSLLRFVFSKPPAEINGVIHEFAKKIQAHLISSDLELSVFDAQVLNKPDHSLDFSSTSSCFQLSRHGSALPPHEMKKLLDTDEIKNVLIETYTQYSVSQIDSCSVGKNLSSASIIASSGTWLVILAGLIGIAALVSTCTACCIFNRYQRQMRSSIASSRIPSSDIYGSSAPVLYTEPIYGPL